MPSIFMKLGNNKRFVLICSLVTVLFSVLFFIIGYFSGSGAMYNSYYDDSRMLKQLRREADPEQTAFFVKNIRAENIRQHLKSITSIPHVAGEPAQRRTGQYVLDFWKSQGFDKVMFKPYDVLLSLPINNTKTKFTIWDTSRNVAVFESQTVEKPLSPHDNSSIVLPPILAFAPGGSVQGQPVYANYGGRRDFIKLRNLGVNLNGTIAVMRFGMIYRGKKLLNAAEFGCLGGIVFSDPSDPWGNPQDPNHKYYPNTWWLPPTGVQHGSAKFRQGDPLTPDLPSTDYIIRRPLDEIIAAGVFPPVPGYPVGFGDAKQIIDRLVPGPANRTRWRGGLYENYYNVGPGFVNSSLQVKLEVNQEYVTKTAYNVLAVIRGEIEPDRYVIIGNHRDAWVYGSVDPSSGSATLLEYSRILGELLKTGWRPRRTIILCSWDAEEFGIIGSWEWVEEEFYRIKTNTVAYVNIDIAVRGNYTIRSNASPSLRELAKTALKKVADPFFSGTTLYDTWSKRLGVMNTPISSSDYSPFIQKAGLPVIDVSYLSNPAISSYYPLYHSRYETFYAMDTFIDPGFLAHKGACRYIAEVIRLLADSYYLDFRLQDFSSVLDTMVGKMLDIQEIKDNEYNMTVLYQILKDETIKFAQVTKCVDSDSVDKKNPVEVRQLNDQKMRVMRGFLSSAGLPNDFTKKNLIFSAKSTEGYVPGGFPGLSDLINGARNATDRNEAWSKVRHHMSLITYHVTLARKFLQSSVKSCWDFV